MWQITHNDVWIGNTRLGTCICGLVGPDLGLDTALNSQDLRLIVTCNNDFVPPLPGPHALHGTTWLTRFGEQSIPHLLLSLVLLLLICLWWNVQSLPIGIDIFFNFIDMFSVLLISTSWVDRLIIILLQRGRLSPSVPLLHDAPGNHVTQPCFIPDASSGSKEDTGST